MQAELNGNDHGLSKEEHRAAKEQLEAARQQLEQTRSGLKWTGVFLDAAQSGMRIPQTPFGAQGGDAPLASTPESAEAAAPDTDWAGASGDVQPALAEFEPTASGIPSLADLAQGGFDSLPPGFSIVDTGGGDDGAAQHDSEPSSASYAANEWGDGTPGSADSSVAPQGSDSQHDVTVSMRADLGRRATGPESRPERARVAEEPLISAPAESRQWGLAEGSTRNDIAGIRSTGPAHSEPVLDRSSAPEGGNTDDNRVQLGAARGRSAAARNSSDADIEVAKCND